MALLDQRVDEALRELFSDEEISDFFRDFQDNQEFFQGVNENGFELICGSTDFLAFKNLMVQYKNNLKQEEGWLKSTVEGANSVGCEQYHQFAAEDPTDASLGWFKLCEFDTPKVGANVYIKKISDTESLYRE